MLDDASHTSLTALERALTSLSYLLTRSQTHEREMARAGIEAGRSDLYLLLALADGGGSCRIGDLAARLMVEPSHVTRQAAQLQEQGYVTRLPDPLDGRARTVNITCEGEALLGRLREAKLDRLRRALRDVAEPDVAATARVLSRLIDSYVARTLAEQPAVADGASADDTPADAAQDGAAATAR